MSREEEAVLAIDRNNKQPIFRQIYDILLQELDFGLYEGDQMLPSEKELCGRFGVERNTVRKALQILVEEKRVVRMPGLGTKVISPFVPQVDPPPSPYAGITEPVNSKVVMFITQENYLKSINGESFHYKLIHCIEKRFSLLGYTMIFKSVAVDDGIVEAINVGRPQGIIFDSYNQTSRYQEVARSGLPAVSINHYTPYLTSIVSNNFDGAYQVAKLLTTAGHRRIAFIMGKENHQTSIERMNGIRSLYADQGLVLQDEYLFHGNWLFNSGVKTAEQILAMKEAQRPTAVFAFNDDMAYGCYSALQRRGYRVPDDISLVGFDKSQQFEVMFPPITTVDVDLDAIVDYACWYLVDQLENRIPRVRAKIQIDTTICDNGTVKTI